MKKLLPFLAAFLFSLAINAQSPALNIINVTGSNSITCQYPSINYHASVSNYTAGPLTYTWVSLSGTASGTNVTLSNPSQYTVMAFNVANSFSIQQVFSIGINTIIPTSTVVPMSQNISCPVGAPATFTGITTSTATNMSHSWVTPYSQGAVINSGTLSIYEVNAPGIFTYCIKNLVNGCSVCKTVTVNTTSSFPTFSVTSPQQFTLGCGTNSANTINISNAASTVPPGSGPVSYTVLPPNFSGPTYTTGGSLIYPASIPGTYTVIIKDMTNFCETKIPISVLQNTFTPNISLAVLPTTTLNCYTPSITLSGSSTNTNVAYAWGTGSITVTGNSLTVNTTTNASNLTIGNFTFTVTDNTNLCKNTQTVSIYQNIFTPIAVISPTTSLSFTSCISSSSINLSNNSNFNPLSPFSHPLPIVAIAWFGPAPQASLANVNSYSAYTPGIYTVTVQDQNNGCTSQAFKTVGDNRVFPQVTTPTIFNINCPVTTATIFPTLSGSTTGFTYLWAAPPTASVSIYTSSTTVVNLPGNYTITVTNSVTSCATTSVVQVAVCSELAQNLILSSKISIYPNPCNDFVNFELDIIPDGINVEIYSAMGILVKKKAIIGQKTIFDLQKEASGIYFIHVLESGKTIKVAKIVKQ